MSMIFNFDINTAMNMNTHEMQKALLKECNYQCFHIDYIASRLGQTLMCKKSIHCWEHLRMPIVKGFADKHPYFAAEKNFIKHTFNQHPK